ncbi:MAG: DUF1573 domain-containing protein [Sphingomonadales bacterium]|nr:DUF1573 domain-containing protein [Sphingomonadales bacterium]
MKNILLLLSLLVFGHVARAQETRIETMSGDTLNFGTCNLGDTIEAVFAFVVKGTKKLLIRQVHPGCQCTVPMYPKDSMPPGTKDSIVLALHTRNLHAGPVEKFAIVINTGPERIFYLKGEIMGHGLAPPKRRVVRAGDL